MFLCNEANGSRDPQFQQHGYGRGILGYRKSILYNMAYYIIVKNELFSQLDQAH
jgi:hypothetical protein